MDCSFAIRELYTPGERTPLALLYKDEALCESCEEGTFRREVLERGCFLKVKGDGSSGELCWRTMIQF